MGFTPEGGDGPDSATRLVYVPTNRPFESAFRSVVAEADAFSSGSNDTVRLLVIDDCSAQVSRSNRELVQRLGHEHGRSIHVLTAEGWGRFVHSITSTDDMTPEDASVARSALLKPTGSYGAGPNKAALVAAFTGAASLHRRDSDQMTKVDVESGYSPLRVEAELLGRAPAGGAVGDGPGIYCVGSSLTGEPTLDRRDLRHCSSTFVERLDALSRLSPEEVRVPRAEPPAVVEDTILGGGVVAERDHTGSVEMGVAALRDVYRWIPEMPAVGVLGSDYFQKGLLYQLELPVWHHDLRAHHVYEPWRAAQNNNSHLRWYAVAELRYVILRYHWNVFNQSLMQYRSQLLSASGKFYSAAYGEMFLEALRKGERRSVDISREFVSVYREAADRASGGVKQRLNARVSALEEEVESTPRYISDAIYEFAGLARLWPLLISSAERLGNEQKQVLQILDNP